MHQLPDAPFSMTPIMVARSRFAAKDPKMLFAPVLRSLQPRAASAARRVHIERKLEQLGYVLPAVAEPKGNYRTCVRSGNYIFTAGHLPQPAGGDLITGKVGKDVTTEEAYDAAHYIALSLMATLKHELGDLDKVKRVVKVVGFVNCVDGFTAQPAVVNGASDTIGKVFGDKGVHARSAVGTNALPLNVPVEIEAIVEIEE